MARDDEVEANEFWNIKSEQISAIISIRWSSIDFITILICWVFL